MKIILLCNGAANQRALAYRLSSVVELSAIAVIRPLPRKSERIGHRLMRGVLGHPLRRAWFSLLTQYDYTYPTFPDVPLSYHEGVNSESVLSLVDEIQPDLVLVSGTDLLRHPLIEAIHRWGKVVNLHTGISPYIKGGPNCTNWALFIKRPDLIGNTVMWLDTGIDSGNIVSTERTPLKGDESLSDLHRKVMDHGHDLYCRAVACIVSGSEVPSIKQSSLAAGRVFLSKEWTAAAALRTVCNYYRIFNSRMLSVRGAEVLIPLPACTPGHTER
ncbi:MAG: formyltransferase family protein [Hydrogenophaga sp.]|nr:formyltransferase family protein [Hydrogenophaga sp.]